MVDKIKNVELAKPPPTDVETEFAALRGMIDAMQRLDRDAQSRVLTYLKERFSVYIRD